MRADSIKIESDEDGFVLVIETDEAPPRGLPLRQLFRVEDPEELHDAVKREIGPWLHERDAARAAYTRPPTIEELEEDEDAYELSDPKHPRHHEVYADLATKEER